jgi:hypothetical protein
MKKIVRLTESELVQKIFKILNEQGFAKDKKDRWGRPLMVNGKPSLWFGFDTKTKKYVEGQCAGLSSENNNEACRRKLGMKTRSEMSAKEEALAYQPKTSKNTPWPIQVNYYVPFDKKFPTGHIECRSLKEPQYQMNANPIRNNWVESLFSTAKSNNFWNMPMTGKKWLPDKPKNAQTIFVYLTNKEYQIYKSATPKLNLKLSYNADKLKQAVKSPDQAITNYNVLTQNCADGVAKSLGVSVEKTTTTEKIIIGAATLLSPLLGGGLAMLNDAIDTTLPADVFMAIKEQYKGRWTSSLK